MSASGFWVALDPQGLVHEIVTASFPILLHDNNVDYAEGDVSLCGNHSAGVWQQVDVADFGFVTCIACWAERFRLDQMQAELDRRVSWF